MTQYRSYRYPPLDMVLAKIEADQVQDSVSASLVFQQAVERGQRDGYEQGLQEGHRAGYESGKVAGHADGAKAAREEVRRELQGELQRLSAPLNALLGKLEALHADWQSSLRRDVVELVGRVARQVVRCEITLQPAQMLSLVEETLTAMPGSSGPIEVFFNPGDLQRIVELDAKRNESWSLHPDPSLDAGECRIRVGDSEVDAGCRQRLAACMDQVRTQLQPDSAT